ncbi:MAG: hypothetical protein ABIJ40_20895 [Bacteroidota bacterium]
MVKEEQLELVKGAKSVKKVQPVKKKAGSVSAVIWHNKSEKDGEESEFPSIHLERNYKGKDGKFHTTGSLRMRDIPDAILVLQKAYELLRIR